MTRYLVNLEIIVEADFRSEVETIMHKMLRDFKTEISISDYGLDVEYMD